MEEFDFLIILAVFLFIIFLQKYIKKIFDKNRTNKNSTRHEGSSYSSNEYNINGYNKDGYNIEGKNKNGGYNRIFDTYSFSTSKCNRDGFYNHRYFPIRVTKHAVERMTERMSVQNEIDARELAYEAYCYGKSKRQVKKVRHCLLKK